MVMGDDVDEVRRRVRVGGKYGEDEWMGVNGVREIGWDGMGWDGTERGEQGRDETRGMA